ncbi:hypothetical protein B0T44_23570 [Nocardia donostiensis]|uniref:Uncharacterized protein n=1 Tax=Nocardia donostiensis TaxID=1538463 RepID=A0A1W0AUD3_9NOCA|nr:hypothetical protein B0T46_14470 [Nocardia donostiensis]OQS13826.1 hypothetical protein B0T36_16910 [Nocardia donostiensis]OQS17702.1 hypothetical protein B0T44_23570 [Nocardia donostiensis]
MVALSVASPLSVTQEASNTAIPRQQDSKDAGVGLFVGGAKSGAFVDRGSEPVWDSFCYDEVPDQRFLHRTVD